MLNGIGELGNPKAIPPRKEVSSLFHASCLATVSLSLNLDLGDRPVLREGTGGLWTGLRAVSVDCCVPLQSIPAWHT
jgi:hypothetical protein